MKQPHTKWIYFPMLPGMEDEYSIVVPPPTTEPNKHSRRDLYNLRLLKGLKAADINGFPMLRAWSPISISKPIAFHEARSYYRKHGTLNGYFVHFYINDDLFDCIRNSPERYLAMLKSADFIIAPDFSTFRNYPLPVLLKNAFDNILLAAFFQREGCNVVANVIWTVPIFYELTFSGQPVGSTICVSSKSLDLRDKKGVTHWLHGYAEAIHRLRPIQIIRMGKVVPGEEVIYGDPMRVEIINPYTERMRNGR